MKEQMDQFDEIFKLESLRGERIHLNFNWFLYSSVCFLSSLVYYLGASIGASLYPDDTEDMKQLLKNADDAMYYVKKQNKKVLCFIIELPWA